MSESADPTETGVLRPLTEEEGKVARDPGAWTSAPLPPAEECPIDCTCFLCIPGA